MASGKRTLLVSYRQLREVVRDDFADIDQYGLFINHTLWNPPSDRIYFYLRANFRSDSPKVDVPLTIRSDRLRTDAASILWWSSRVGSFEASILMGATVHSPNPLRHSDPADHRDVGGGR